MLVLEKEQELDLIRQAFSARKLAYIPYSGFAVGAALLTKQGEVILGCNIENASYGATNCAERTAIFKAVSEGKRDFAAIAIVGGKSQEMDSVSDFAYPCGICRQVMKEFCASEFEIIVAKSETEYRVHTLEELLPYGFGGSNLS